MNSEATRLLPVNHPLLLDDVLTRSKSIEMTISVGLDGQLVETHKTLEVKGVRYLLEPVDTVSHRLHLFYNTATAEAFRAYRLPVILVHPSLQSLMLTTAARKSLRSGFNKASTITRRLTTSFKSTSSREYSSMVLETNVFYLRMLAPFSPALECNGVNT